MTAADWGLLLALSVLWGVVLLRKSHRARVAAADGRAGQTAIAALALWLYLRAPPGAEVARPSGLRRHGSLNNLIPAVTWSQKTIASYSAAILIATTPLFSILAAHWLTSDVKMTANKIAGTLPDRRSGCIGLRAR